MPDIKMPQLGESVTEGTIGKWLKQPGDQIRKYEPLCEVITDKVNAEVPSDFEGTLTAIMVNEGDTVPVGTVIAVIETAAEAPGTAQLLTADSANEDISPADAVKGESLSSQPARESAAASATAEGSEARARFSPAVMRLLQEHRLDASHITGTGAGGRITRKDVLAHIEAGGSQSMNRVAAESSSDAYIVQPAASVTPAGGAQAVTEPKMQPAPGRSLQNGDIEIPVTPIRQTIAKRMLESKHSAPHAWTMVEADVTRLVKYRESVKDSFKQHEGISLTFLPFFIKAVVESLKEFPIINSTWAGDKIIIKKRINISIAVATDDALFVPVIKDADRMSILGLAHAIQELAQKARSGKLSADDISGGTFTVNNTGAFGSVLSQPIINSPQAAILSMESIVKRPIVLDNDAIAVRSMMNLCLSLDHRVLDGLVCGRFLAAVKQRLESFDGSSVNLY